MILWRRLRPDLLLGLAYFAAAAGALVLTRFDGGVAFLWIASPLLIAVLASRRRRTWNSALVSCGIASFVATGLFGYGWGLAAPFALVNITEAFVGATLLRRVRYARNGLGSVPWLIHFILCVGIAAPLASGLVAALSLGIAGKPLIEPFIRFFTGHALSNITFVPVIGMILRGGLKKAMRLTSRRRTVEAIGHLGLVALVSGYVFSQTTHDLLFLPMLPVILTTFRVGHGGAAMAMGVLALVGGGLTVSGGGPMHLTPMRPGDAIQFFEFYLAAMVLTVFPVAADLRHRGRLHRKLRLSEERYRLVSDHSTDIVMHLELDGRIRFISPSVKQMGGYDPDALIGRNASFMIAPQYLERVSAEHVATILAEGETRSFDYEAITYHGEQRWFETHSRAVIDEDGQIDGVLSFIRDVTARKATEQRLREFALTDPLTGLPNRRAFRELAMACVPAVGEPPTHVVAVLDFDHFKAVNDRYGHDAGDAVLRAFAIVSRAVLRPTDVVARLGGEEFGLLLPETNRQDAVAICERLRAALADHAICVGGQRIGVTISGGVAVLGPAGLDASLKQADEALYRAKHLGRDRMSLAA